MIWTWVLTLTFYQQLTVVTMSVGLGMLALWLTVTMAIKLIKALAAFVKDANIKKISLKGVELYDDVPVVKPKRRVVRKVVK